ncbi:MAG: isoprenylcysteine carboxylmethyltransferase family protein [Streptosporangiaceae bacterium]
MSRRWMGWLLLLYPRAWRDRYGREVLSLTEEMIRAGDASPLRAGLDLVTVALLERARPLIAGFFAVRTLIGRFWRASGGLVVRNLVFTVVVPGLGGVWLPWRLLTAHGRPLTPVAWEAVPVIADGAALYMWCIWNFAVVGRGTPGPWDAPSRVVAAGPYQWVRNPIYIAALAIVAGEAWLFGSLRLLAYAALMAVFFHLFVTGYEERRLCRRFGRSYLEYRRAVPRWIPHA